MPLWSNKWLRDVTSRICDLPCSIYHPTGQACDVTRLAFWLNAVGFCSFNSKLPFFEELGCRVHSFFRAFLISSEISRDFSEISPSSSEISRKNSEGSPGFSEISQRPSEISPGFPEISQRSPESSPGFPEISPALPETSLSLPATCWKL
jgi:hypothetical protein